MAKTHKILRELREIAKRRGWESYEHRNSGHVMFFHSDPDVKPVTESLTPSDHRWRENFERDLRKAEKGVL